MKARLAVATLATLVLSLAPNAVPDTHAATVAEQRVALTVTRKGFEPASVRVKSGRPVRLVVTRQAQRTCATEIVIAGLGIQQPLPLGKPVELRFTPRKSGTLRYACAMDMIAGQLVVE